MAYDDQEEKHPLEQMFEQHKAMHEEHKKKLEIPPDPSTGTSIKKIIQNLLDNEHRIGALVIACVAKPGGKLKCDDGDTAEGLIYCGDVVYVSSDVALKCTMAHTMLCRGLVNTLHDRLG